MVESSSDTVTEDDAVDTTVTKPQFPEVRIARNRFDERRQMSERLNLALVSRHFLTLCEYWSSS